MEQPPEQDLENLRQSTATGGKHPQGLLLGGQPGKTQLVGAEPRLPRREAAAAGLGAGVANAWVTAGGAWVPAQRRVRGGRVTHSKPRGTNAAQLEAERCRSGRRTRRAGSPTRASLSSLRHARFSSTLAVLSPLPPSSPFSSGKGPCSASCPRSASGHRPRPLPWATGSFGSRLAGVPGSFNLERGSSPPDFPALVWDVGGSVG